MESPKTIEQLLADQINEKDCEIRKLHQRIEEMEKDLRGADSGWTLHQTLERQQTLPVPRLELVWEPDGYEGAEWYERVAKYRLVYRAFWDDVLAIPLGETHVKGGSGKQPPIHDGKIEMLFRDGAHICHDMAILRLPGFLICGDLVQDISYLAGKPSDRQSPPT